MINVLINGYGNIGKYMYEELKPLLNKGFNIDIYDPFIDEYKNKRDIIYDVEFICVPTNNNADNTVNTSIVENLLKQNSATYTVIKSTVPIGFCDKMQSIKKHLIYSPEYWGTTLHAPKQVDFLVLAGELNDCALIAQMYYKIKSGSFRIRFTTYKTAEIAKYMENCFLGLKVTFCNEFADIANDYGVSYPELREIFIMDSRMGDSHTLVDPEQPYYDSHCLNKDIPALVALSNKTPLMREVVNINLAKKQAVKKH